MQKNWEIAYAQQKNTLQKFNDTWLKMKAVEKTNRNRDDVEVSILIINYQQLVNVPLFRYSMFSMVKRI